MKSRNVARRALPQQEYYSADRGKRLGAIQDGATVQQGAGAFAPIANPQAVFANVTPTPPPTVVSTQECDSQIASAQAGAQRASFIAGALTGAFALLLFIGIRR